MGDDMSLASAIASHPPPQWKPRPQVLLCANTVKPMHGVVPRVILGREWWDKERQAAYLSTDFHCVACGVHRSLAKECRWLEGHESYSVDYRRGLQTYVETVPLCHYCHNFIHDGRLAVMFNNGEVTEEKYKAVMLHGMRVLGEAGLVRRLPNHIRMAPWGKWRLVLFGKKYPPIYKDYYEWMRAFGHADIT